MDRDKLRLLLNEHFEQSYNAGYAEPDDPSGDAHRMKAGVARAELEKIYDELDMKATAYDAMVRIMDTYRQTTP